MCHFTDIVRTERTGQSRDPIPTTAAVPMAAAQPQQSEGKGAFKELRRPRCTRALPLLLFRSSRGAHPCHLAESWPPTSLSFCKKLTPLKLGGVKSALYHLCFFAGAPKLESEIMGRFGFVGSGGPLRLTAVRASPPREESTVFSGSVVCAESRVLCAGKQFLLGVPVRRPAALRAAARCRTRVVASAFEVSFTAKSPPWSITSPHRPNQWGTPKPKKNKY